MKNKLIIPTSREKVMRESDFIVSKTDTKGRITYGNEIFIEFSGYSEEELLGSQHNIVRHPDMPRCAFAFLWQEISSGREFFAYVKNMAKDGSYYWVFTNVTPDLDQHGNIIGYFSVRRKPKPEAVRAIEPIYAALLDAEKKAGPANAIHAGTQLLLDTLNANKVTYEEFILSI